MNYVESFFTENRLTSHIEREHQPSEFKPNNKNNVFNNNILPETQKQDNNSSIPYEIYGNVIIGPSNVGKTYCMLKMLEKIGNKRPINIKTRSPNQYPNFKTKVEIKPIDKYKG